MTYREMLAARRDMDLLTKRELHDKYGSWTRQSKQDFDNTLKEYKKNKQNLAESLCWYCKRSTDYTLCSIADPDNPLPPKGSLYNYVYMERSRQKERNPLNPQKSYKILDCKNFQPDKGYEWLKELKKGRTL